MRDTPLFSTEKNIHTAIQEQNVLPGLTTKKFSRKSTIVFTHLMNLKNI